jgi:trimethylamine:corrinoid methyltransferase-like protein
MLDEYEAPPIDPDLLRDLTGYVDRRKSEIGAGIGVE